MTHTTHTQDPIGEERFLAARLEIFADAEELLLPAPFAWRGFADLHEYCDANEYGGGAWEDHAPVDTFAALQERLDQWIRSARHLADFTRWAREGAPALPVAYVERERAALAARDALRTHGGSLLRCSQASAATWRDSEGNARDEQGRSAGSLPVRSLLLADHYTGSSLVLESDRDRSRWVVIVRTFDRPAGTRRVFHTQADAEQYALEQTEWLRAAGCLPNGGDPSSSPAVYCFPLVDLETDTGAYRFGAPGDRSGAAYWEDGGSDGPVDAPLADLRSGLQESEGALFGEPVLAREPGSPCATHALLVRFDITPERACEIVSRFGTHPTDDEGENGGNALILL